MTPEGGYCMFIAFPKIIAYVIESELKLSPFHGCQCHFPQSPRKVEDVAVRLEKN